jgi:hypothetical protein
MGQQQIEALAERVDLTTDPQFRSELQRDPKQRRRPPGSSSTAATARLCAQETGRSWATRPPCQSPADTTQPGRCHAHMKSRRRGRPATQRGLVRHKRSTVAKARQPAGLREPN